MLLKSREAVPYAELINKAVVSIKKQGYTDIRAMVEDYETPSQLIGKTNEINFTPDLTATKNEGKAYFEIAQKQDDRNELINKWKLLSTLAAMKNGKFQIFVPHGQMKFTQELIQENNINAELSKI